MDRLRNSTLTRIHKPKIFYIFFISNFFIFFLSALSIFDGSGTKIPDPQHCTAVPVYSTSKWVLTRFDAKKRLGMLSVAYQ